MGMKKMLKSILKGYLWINVIVMHVSYCGALLRRINVDGVPMAYLTHPMKYVSDMMYDDFIYYLKCAWFKFKKED